MSGGICCYPKGGSDLKIAAYQFAVTGNPKRNLAIMTAAVIAAANRQAELILFPECALSGYPPRDLPSSADADFTSMDEGIAVLRRLSEEYGICIVFGAITKSGCACLNTAFALLPDGREYRYAKRALWGWDRDNFVPGDTDDVFDYRGFRIGMRICYEVRFPEYFRELRRKDTNLNMVLFYDVSDHPNPERYELIRAHLRTRASENICAVLSANAVSPHQSAPTLLCDAGGRVCEELRPEKEALLICDYSPAAPGFSERGRMEITGALLNTD